MAVKNLLLLALLGVLLVTVQGQEEKKATEEKATKEEEKKSEEEEDEDEREVSFEREDKKITIRSEKKELNVETEVKFVFSVSGFPNIRLTNKEEGATTETEANFRVGLMKIVEVDPNLYDTPFNSTKFTKLSGSGSSWSKIQMSNVTAEKGNATVFTFTSTKVVANKMKVTWETVVANTKTNITKEGLSLSPKAVKFSLRVTDYVYSPNASPDTTLAVVGEAFTKIEKEVEAPKTETKEGEAATKEGEAAKEEEKEEESEEEIILGEGSFSWDNWVMVDGTKNVTLKPHKPTGNQTAPKDDDEAEDDNSVVGEEGRLMAWVLESATVKKPTNFYWDPTLSAEEKSSANMAGFSVLLLTFAALVSLF